MSGDWIKMRCNLWDDPRISRLVEMTDSSEAAVIGALYWIWATADQHTEDGHMPGLTLRQVDRKTGVPGFAAALVDIGWMTDGPQGVVIQKFEEHNGTSAKRRCAESRRKMSARDADNTRTGSGQVADGMQTTSAPREEKIREEIQDPPTPGGVAPPRPEKAPRPAKRCPESFAIGADMARSMRDECPGVDIDAETRKFRDHTFSTARSDWLATWRNWIRGAAERLPQARASPPRVSAAALAMAAANPSIAAPHLRQQLPHFEVFDVAAVRLD